MNTPKVLIPENPVLWDKFLGPIQTTLFSKLAWLDHSFGKIQKLVTPTKNSTFYYPAVHLGWGDYLSVLPDQKLGNFSFFEISDPQEYDRSKGTISAKFALVFWFDLDKIFNNSEDRNLEAIKSQILDILKHTNSPGGRMTINRIFERAENIYSGFSLKEIETQFLMQPFGGLRFEGDLILLQDECTYSE